MREVGEIIKDLRKEKGLSTRQLGKKLGVTNATVSRWETGATYIIHPNIVTICKFFNISSDYLLGLEDND